MKINKINDIMAKNDITELPTSIVEIKSIVTYQGESLESVVKFNVDSLAQLVQSSGGEAANKSLKTITDQLYTKTSDNLKLLINK
jgi:hypothetical protein